MTKTETPRDGDGVKLCAWCGSEIRQSGLGRSRDYCRRSCRQRAYEARKQREAIVSAVAAAVARRDSSRVDSRTPDSPSRDESRGVGDFLLAPPAVTAGDPGDGWVRSPGEVDAQLRELEARRAVGPVVPAPTKRRRMPPPPPSAPMLFGPEAADGE